MVLSDPEKEALKKKFAGIVNDIELIVFTQEMECQFCKQTRELVLELGSLSPKIKTKVFDLVKDQEEALDRIGKYVAPGQVIDYRLRRAQEVIDAFLLPHIGQKAEDRLAKAYYLTMMSTKAIERAYKLRGQDDKDHYANKNTPAG